MTHQAKVTEVLEASDGALTVRARCCDDETSESVLTICGLDRADEAIDAEVQAHVARVAKAHADRERAKAHIARLIG